MKKIKIKSIYLKILLMTTTIIVLASLISGTLMFNLLTVVLTDNKIDDMESTAIEISQSTVDFLESCRNESMQTGFDAEWGENSDILYYNLVGKMETYYRMMDFIIFIADDKGTIQASVPSLPGKSFYGQSDDLIMDESIAINLNYYDNNYHFKVSQQYEETLSSSEFLEDRTDYYGLFSDTKEQYLTVSKRIEYFNEGQRKNQVAGSIIVALPVPELTNAQSKLILLFIISTIVALLIDIILISVFTRKIISPIKELQKASEKIAEGNFDCKVEKNTEDELGVLIESFNTMSLALSRMDSVKNEFISNVSHELRTPITSIRGFIEGILDGVIPEEKQPYYLNLAKEEADRMNNLINELLDMTRIEFAKQNMFEKFDINGLVTEILIKMEPQISAKKIDVDLNFEKSSQFVCAGKASISRVIINLVHNATKFTPEGGNITVSVNENDGKVEVSIADTGIGISEEEVSRIFERFYKSDKSRGMDKTGTGLGLAIVKKILASHGENITCQSTLGKGTEFIFTLKAAEPDIDESIGSEE